MNSARTTKANKEPMMKTWGRIRQLSENGISNNNSAKLMKFIEKFDNDLSVAKVDERYFEMMEDIEKLYEVVCDVYREDKN